MLFIVTHKVSLRFRVYFNYLIHFFVSDSWKVVYFRFYKNTILWWEWTAYANLIYFFFGNSPTFSGCHRYYQPLISCIIYFTNDTLLVQSGNDVTIPL